MGGGPPWRGSRHGAHYQAFGRQTAFCIASYPPPRLVWGSPNTGPPTTAPISPLSMPSLFTHPTAITPHSSHHRRRDRHHHNHRQQAKPNPRMGSAISRCTIGRASASPTAPSGSSNVVNSSPQLHCQQKH
jgi:hypothetical protein